MPTVITQETNYLLLNQDQFFLQHWNRSLLLWLALGELDGLHLGTMLYKTYVPLNHRITLSVVGCEKRDLRAAKECRADSQPP